MSFFASFHGVLKSGVELAHLEFFCIGPFCSVFFTQFSEQFLAGFCLTIGFSHHFPNSLTYYFNPDLVTGAEGVVFC